MSSNNITHLVKQALTEDLRAGDITSELLIPKEHQSTAYILAKQTGIICGLAFVHETFRQLSSKIMFKNSFRDGQKIKAGQKLISMTGPTRAILSGERTALNFLSYLSGIATTTQRFVQAIKPYKAKICDTRKTTPTLRWVEKWAVKTGGGTNHRFDLSSMVMIKDNHHVARSKGTSLVDVTQLIRHRTSVPLCIEVTTFNQFKSAFSAKPDIILLDNMTLTLMRKCVQFSRQFSRNSRSALEASGGITLANAKKVAQTGVDRLSIGSLTHSRAALDFSLELVN